MTKLEDKVRAMVEGIYYSSEDKETHWEPFEDYSAEDVKSFVDSDVDSWISFIEQLLKERENHVNR